MKRYVTVGLVVGLVTLAAFSVALAGSRSLAWLGVYTQEVDADIADELSLKSDYGAIVNEIVDDSPADKAGFREDDVIIAFNGDRVRDDDDLTDLIRDSRPGDTATFTIVRDGKEQEIRVELGRRPRNNWYGDIKWFEPPRAPKPPRPPVPPRTYSYYFGERPYIGVSLIDLSDRAAKALGAEKGGVLIDDVERDSPAGKAGLAPGDLIVAVDDEEVFEAGDVQEIIGDKDEGDVVRVTVVRNRQKKTLDVKVEVDDESDYHGHFDGITLPGVSTIHRRAPHAYRVQAGTKMADSREYRIEMNELGRELKKLKEDLRDLKKTLH